jgi:F-type H+-transporting ATPase subunit b
VNILISFNGEEFALAEEEEHGEEGETLEGEEGHSEPEEAPNPVIPELNHLIWALGSFLALWALMKFVLLPPLMKLREERENKVREDREAVDRARAAIGQVQAEYDASLSKARSDADSVIDAARAEAGEHRAAVIGDVTNEIADLRASAAGDLDTSRNAAIGSMRGDVGDIAVAAASAVLGKNLDRAEQQAAIDAALTGEES